MNEVKFEFTMNDAYFREFFEEWVAVLGKGWRVDRIMIPTFGLVGAACLVAGAAADFRPLLGVGTVGVLASLFEGWKYWKRRKQWHEGCRALPWFGRTMRLLVREGALVQENEYDGDPRFDRREPILKTPNGYLVRYEAATPIEARGKAISRTMASVYIPLRTASPAMSREECDKLLGVVD